jgi:pimeloyl-ACP methyl ester carboxylesterase
MPVASVRSSSGAATGRCRAVRGVRMGHVAAETRYAGGSVAYQVLGDGPVTLVMNWGWFSNIEAFHEIPGYTSFLETLAGSARVVTFDVRGMGASDRSFIPSFDQRVDDLGAVVNAVGAHNVVLFGASSGGALAIAYAATHAERVRGLVLYGAYPTLAATDHFNFMASPELLEVIRHGLARWGNGATVSPLATSLAASPGGRDLWRRVESACIEPGVAQAWLDVDVTIDVVDLLGQVRAPTLVLHRLNEQFVPPQAARGLANGIPGADLVYLDGLDHYPWLANTRSTTDAIRSFITDEPVEAPRIKSVMLTDIAHSTQQLISVGEDRWSETLARHDEVALATVEAAGGTLVKTTGDGLIALFDGPADSLLCAVHLRDALRELDLEIRTGITVGEVVHRGSDIAGVCVNIAERLAKLAQPNQILVSRGVTVLVAESKFGWLGTRTFKGVPGDRSVFELR